MALWKPSQIGLGCDLERQTAQQDQMTPCGMEESTCILESRGIRRSRARRSKAAWHLVDKELSHLFSFQADQSLRSRICLSVLKVD